MSLINLLEGCKETAFSARAEAAAAAAEDVAEFEEHGEDLAAAFDEQELVDTEEALRLGEELDEREVEETSERERADFEIARKLLAEEEDTDTACSKDEQIAREMEAQLRKEAARVAQLEKRERQLAERKLCKGDIAMAEQLAADIDQEEAELRALERQDRRLASKLVAEESKALANMPQTEEKLKTLSRAINGDGPVSLRTRLRAKLATVRKGVSDITNMMDNAAATGA